MVVRTEAWAERPGDDQHPTLCERGDADASLEDELCEAPSQFVTAFENDSDESEWEMWRASHSRIKRLVRVPGSI